MFLDRFHLFGYIFFIWIHFLYLDIFPVFFWWGSAGENLLSPSLVATFPWFGPSIVVFTPCPVHIFYPCDCKMQFQEGSLEVLSNKIYFTEEQQSWKRCPLQSLILLLSLYFRLDNFAVMGGRRSFSKGFIEHPFTVMTCRFSPFFDIITVLIGK